MISENSELLKSGAACFGIHISEQQVNLFSNYHELLIELNE